MSTRVYVTRIVADEFAERPTEVACHQAVYDGVDGGVRVAWNYICKSWFSLVSKGLTTKI